MRMHFPLFDCPVDAHGSRSRLPARSALNALHRRAAPLPKTQGVFILYEFHSLQINERKLRQSLRSVGAFFMDLRGVERLVNNLYNPLFIRIPEDIDLVVPHFYPSFIILNTTKLIPLHIKPFN